MRKLLIVGAGGHGRCCLDIARDMNIFDDISFLDSRLVGKTINSCSVIDVVENMNEYYPQYDSIFIAIGNNELRCKLINKAKNIGYTITSLISPFCYISKYANIGKGSVIFQNAVIESNVNIGEGCILTSNVTINHDAFVNDYCLIYSNTVIKPEVRLGKSCKIGSNCCIRFGKIIDDDSIIEDTCVL